MPWTKSLIYNQGPNRSWCGTRLDIFRISTVGTHWMVSAAMWRLHPFLSEFIQFFKITKCPLLRIHVICMLQRDCCGLSPSPRTSVYIFMLTQNHSKSFSNDRNNFGVNGQRLVALKRNLKKKYETDMQELGHNDYLFVREISGQI